MDTEHTQSGLGSGQVRVPSTWSSGPVSTSGRAGCPDAQLSEPGRHSKAHGRSV